MKNRIYKSSLTGTGFLFYEIKQVCKQIEKGLSDEKIKRLVYEENLFGYNKVSSVRRSFPTILKRARLLSDPLREILLQDTLENAKLVNLLSITLEDLLFDEFMQEVMKEKYLTNHLVLEKKDVNLYFTYKGEQSEKVRSFSESTINKLRQVYLKIFLEVGILKNLKSGQLKRVFINEILKRALEESHHKKFIEIFQ